MVPAWKQGRLAQAVVHTIVLGKRVGFLLEGRVKLGHFVQQENGARLFGNVVQVILGDFSALRTHVVVNGIDTTFPLLQETF